VIAAALLQDPELVDRFLKRIRLKLQQSYSTVISFLERNGINYARGATTGLFVYIDLSPFLPPLDVCADRRERECELTSKLYDGGVFLQPDEEHYLEPGWYRLVFSGKPQVLDEGLTRSVKA
jgi:1-aminocyclopropane-1-carboxylate synthase